MADYLITPALECLELQCFDPIALDRVLLMACRSSCSIKSLRILGDYEDKKCSSSPSPLHLRPFAQSAAFSSLTSLTIYDCAYEPALSDISVSENDVSLFPDLLEVIVRTKVQNAARFTVVLEMLESRCRRVTGLARKRLEVFRFTGLVDSVETMNKIETDVLEALADGKLRKEDVWAWLESQTSDPTSSASFCIHFEHRVSIFQLIVLLYELTSQRLTDDDLLFRGILSKFRST